MGIQDRSESRPPTDRSAEDPTVEVPRVERSDGHARPLALSAALDRNPLQREPDQGGMATVYPVEDLKGDRKHWPVEG